MANSVYASVVSLWCGLLACTHTKHTTVIGFCLQPLLVHTFVTLVHTNNWNNSHAPMSQT